jgi:large subunit ribosomal protein L32
MALPKKRHTRAARNQRRSHHALRKPKLFYCEKCKEPILSHRVCLKCGTYASQQAIEIKEKKEKGKKSSKKQKNKKAKKQ